jgi:hypothetical protein
MVYFLNQADVSFSSLLAERRTGREKVGFNLLVCLEGRTSNYEIGLVGVGQLTAGTMEEKALTPTFS